MPCISRTPAHPLTPMQIDHLLMFRHAGATSFTNAKDIHAIARIGRGRSLVGRFANTNVIGALCDKGLAEKRSTKRKGRSLTLYWLTRRGRDRARLLALKARKGALR